MARSTGREAIRLWFEYLKRAYADKSFTVNVQLYEPWGDVENTKYETWWKERGRNLFETPKVALVDSGKTSNTSLIARIPTSMTPTQAGNELRQLLIKHYGDNQPLSSREREFALTEGKEMKVASLRAYLHTYDAYQKLRKIELLKQSVNKTGGKGGKLDVSGKDLLLEVRLFYLQRTERWRHTKRKVEGLPPALASGMERNPLTGAAMSFSGTESAALRTVKRYLDSAYSLIERAAGGHFP